MIVAVLVVNRRQQRARDWFFTRTALSYRKLSWLIIHSPLDLHQFPHLLSTRTCFLHLPAATVLFRHPHFTQHRHETDQSLHPKTRSFRTVLLYRTRLLEVTHMPLKYMIGTLPTIVSPSKQAVCSWARCRQSNSWTYSFRSLKMPQSAQTGEGLLRVLGVQGKRSICTHRS